MWGEVSDSPFIDLTDKQIMIFHLRDVFVDSQRCMEWDAAYYEIKNHILLKAPSFNGGQVLQAARVGINGTNHRCN